MCHSKPSYRLKISLLQLSHSLEVKSFSKLALYSQKRFLIFYFFVCFHTGKSFNISPQTTLLTASQVIETADISIEGTVTPKTAPIITPNDQTNFSDEDYLPNVTEITIESAEDIKNQDDKQFVDIEKENLKRI